MEERELINKCLKFNRDAQHELFKRFSGKFLGVLVRYTNDKAEAEDVLQEGFIKLFGNLHKYQYTGSFEGWAKRIMVNCALDYIRQKKEFILSLDDVTDQTNVPEDEVSYEQLKGVPTEVVLEMINQLPIGYKAIFSMKAIDGFSHKEIAEKLGISTGITKPSYFKARNKLKVLLEKYYARGIEYTVVS